MFEISRKNKAPNILLHKEIRTAIEETKRKLREQREFEVVVLKDDYADENIDIYLTKDFSCEESRITVKFSQDPTVLPRTYKDTDYRLLKVCLQVYSELSKVRELNESERRQIFGHRECSLESERFKSDFITLSLETDENKTEYPNLEELLESTKEEMLSEN